MNQIMFWSIPSQKDDTFDSWRNREIRLTALHKLSLLSHSIVSNKVKLFTYQNIVHKLPEGIELVDANEIYQAELAYDALSRGHVISHIADLVKMREAAKSTGVVIDMDAVILRKFPEKGFLCSMPAKLTGAFAPKWGEHHPPLKVIDNSWDGKALAAFPASVDEAMRHYMYNISKTIEQKLASKPTKGIKGWNYMVWALKDIPNEKNKYRVLQPIFTCPVPAWMGKGKCYSLEYPTRFDGKTTLFGYTMPTINDILSTSLCVQHFFESAFKGDERTGEGFWEKVHQHSLLGREAHFVLGEDWRKVLSEK